MAASFGFNFGGKSTATGATTSGFSFGPPGANQPTGFATPAQQTASGGFSLGGNTAQSTGLFGPTQPQTSSLGALSFGGGTATTGVAKPTLNFGTPAAATAGTGFQLGGLQTTQATPGGLSFGSTAKPAATAQKGLTFGASTFGATAPTTQSGFSFGNAAGTSGFTLGGLGSTTATATPGFGTLGGGSSLGGSLSLGSTNATTGAIATTASAGLGGITLTSSSAAISTNLSKSSDSKVVLDSQVPAQICNTVTAFKNYVKKQKSFKDDIASFSDKPLHTIREDTIALKQLLAVLDSTFQRNAAASHRLKEESSQTLKSAEIAQRTKEIPLGLQGDNYAPSEYFHRLVREFEEQFQQYRHLIEQLERQMSAMNQQASYTPQELSQVMVKLNETFIALAAQLQGVHDLVKAQKEQYLTYRRVFHSESKDVFAARKKSVVDQRRIKSAPTGSRAFEGTSNAAALAMWATLNGQPTATGVSGPVNPGVGFGAPTGTTGGLNFGRGTTGFGTTGIGGNTGTTFGGGFGAGFGGSSFGAGTSLFGKPATTTSGLNFGGSLSAGPLGSASGGFGSAAQGTSFGTTPFGTTTTGKPLQLQKPPSKYRKSTR